MSKMLVLMLLYALCGIVAGHGVAPLGLLLFSGGYDAWYATGKILGWMGVTCLVLAAVSFPSGSISRPWLQLTSAFLLYASWLDIALQTDNESGSLATTVVLSIPFQITFVIVVVRLAFEIRRLRTASTSA